MNKTLATYKKLAANLDRIAALAKNVSIIFNSLGEPIISGVVDVVPNFWTSYGGIVLIVTSTVAGICLVATVTLGIKHQRLYAMFLVLHNSHDVRGENAPLFSYIAPTTRTMRTTPQIFVLHSHFGHNRELYLCPDNIIYIVQTL